ncbi:MAG: hypothetical protein WBQ77_10390, partial [Methyloceanibacter sp.]|uniref:hypothetical protein n=1 Tax=Methyloceanibacter sp. TaxID=1965321 RepID=UPI003C40306A
ADVHHHREADHLRRAVEITEGIAHRRRLRMPPARLKPIYSDNALWAIGRLSIIETQDIGCEVVHFLPAHWDIWHRGMYGLYSLNYGFYESVRLLGNFIKRWGFSHWRGFIGNNRMTISANLFCVNKTFFGITHPQWLCPKAG